MTWFAAYLAFTLLLAGLAWYPCCCGTEPPTPYARCADCIGDDENVPQFYTVYIPALANVNCTACASYAGTYVLETNYAYPCNSIVAHSSPCSEEGGYVTMAIGTQWIDGAWVSGIIVMLSQGIHLAYTNYYRWNLDTESDYDCLNFTDLAIPFHSQSYSPQVDPTTWRCDASGSDDVLVTSGDVT